MLVGRWVLVLSAAFMEVIDGSVPGARAGITQKLGTRWFWLGHQGVGVSQAVPELAVPGGACR